MGVLAEGCGFFLQVGRGIRVRRKGVRRWDGHAAMADLMGLAVRPWQRAGVCRSNWVGEIRVLGRLG